MFANRPHIKVESTTADHVMELIAIVGVLAGLAVVLAAWPSLPQQVPVRVNLAGQPVAWGDRNTLFLLPAIGALVYGLLTLGGMLPPWLYNYPWKITEENAPRQYQLARRLMRSVKLICAWLFTFITLDMVRLAHGHTGFTMLATPALLAAVFVVIVVYFVLSYRAR